MSKTALILVDVQYDFLPPNGALAVPNGREIIPLIKDLLGVKGNDALDWNSVIATQDYHPKGHISFASTHERKPLEVVELEDGWGRMKDHTLWPDHCVIDTPGCQIDQDLQTAFGPWTSKMKLARKGWDKTVENYSAFEGYLTDITTPSDPPTGLIKQSLAKDSELSKYLVSQRVKKVVVVGLATDYCVNSTALSAIDGGFDTCVYTPCVRGIDAQGCQDALEGVKAKGGSCMDDLAALKEWVE